MAGTVKFDIDGAVATITLDNPAKRNSIDLPMAAALIGVARAIAGDERIAAVILRGAGDRAFCAGADFDAMTEGGAIARNFSALEAAIEEASAEIAKIEVPIVAAIDGACFGAGVQMALTADIRLASADARFGIPAITLGIIYPLEAIASIVRLAGAGSAAHFLFGAEPIDATTASSYRFVDRVVPKEEIQQEAAKLAHRIAAHPRAAVRGYKAVIRGLAEGRGFTELREVQRKVHESPDLVQRLEAIAAKRAAKK